MRLRSPTGLLASLSCVFTAGCATDQDTHSCLSYAPGFVQIRVRDTRGGSVAITEAWLERNGLLYPCNEHNGRIVECKRDEGVYAVTAVVNGLELHGEAVITRNESCSHDSEPVELIDPRTVCVPGELEVVRGELFWSEDKPVVADDGVTVYAKDDDNVIECRVDANHYSCSAIDRDASLYTVFARFAGSTLRQEVPVQLADCVISEPAELSFVRSSWPCEPRLERAILVTVARAADDPAGRPQHLELPAGAVRVVDAAGASRDCDLVMEEPYLPYFYCTLLTPAAGHYTVEVSVGARLEKLLTYVQDDGCAPSRSDLELELSDDQVCDFGRCGPSGEPLRAQALCGAIISGNLKEPPCAER